MAETNGNESTPPVVQRDSKQARFSTEGNLANVSLLADWVYRSHLVEPEFGVDTRNYDNWLYDFANNEPHLVGILSSVVSKDKNRAWYLTGGIRSVQRFGDRLRAVEGGDGWRHFMSLQSRSYYNSNIGAITEIETATGNIGDEMVSLYHVDPTVARLLDNYARPLRYYPRRGRVQDWFRGEFFRTVSNPDSREKWRGVGMCAVNRCLSLAKMLVAVYEHDLEMLGASPPRGFLIGDGISQNMYKQAKAERAQAKENDELEFDVLALFGNTANVKTNLQFVPYSTLPTNFDLEQFTYLIMLGYSLAFGYDAQEFYPIKSGSFGRGAEAEIQAEKTTYKGEADFSLEYQNHIQDILPETLAFEFDRNDIRGDLLQTEYEQAEIDKVNSLYVPSNRQLGESGLIDRNEGRELLATQGILPPEWLLETELEETSDVDRMRRQYRNDDRLIRQSEKQPDEPIVRYEFNPKIGRARTQVLWQRGGDLRDSHRVWQGYSLQPKTTKRDNSGVFHDPFLAYAVGHETNCDCGACVTEYIPKKREQFIGYEPINRAEDGDILYNAGDVLITTGDVDLAIIEAYEVSDDWGDIMNATLQVRVANILQRAFTWDAISSRYRYENGQFVSSATVREWATESIDHATDRSAFLAEQVQSGVLSPADFNLIAREEIKREYIRQIIAGRGGRDQMTQSDWGRIGQQLQVQYGYLDGFTEDILNSDFTIGQINTRLSMYYNSAQHAYFSGVVASYGIAYDQLPAYPADGTTICLTNCKCFWDFTEIYDNGVLVGFECRWRLTASKNCDTCLERADTWNPLTILFSDN